MLIEEEISLWAYNEGWSPNFASDIKRQIHKMVRYTQTIRQ